VKVEQVFFVSTTAAFCGVVSHRASDDCPRLPTIINRRCYMLRVCPDVWQLLAFTDCVSLSLAMAPETPKVDSPGVATFEPRRRRRSKSTRQHISTTNQVLASWTDRCDDHAAITRQCSRVVYSQIAACANRSCGLGGSTRMSNRYRQSRK